MVDKSSTTDVVGEDCELCGEFKGSQCPHLDFDRILYSDSEFVVVPALGGFIEGYLLICSRVHEPSFASLGEYRIRRFISLLADVEEIVARSYASPWIFEHGVTRHNGKAGGCIDHAHMHVVPGDLRLNHALKDLGSSTELASWGDLHKWAERPYLLVKAPDGRVTIYDAAPMLPSQFLRRHAARAVGLPEEWNWAIYSHELNIERTLMRLRAEFERLPAF